MIEYDPDDHCSRLRQALAGLMAAVEGYRQQQETSECVNDGWDRVIAAYAVARDRLASPTPQETT